jgi:hypothetical protein
MCEEETLEADEKKASASARRGRSEVRRKTVGGINFTSREKIKDAKMTYGR